MSIQPVILWTDGLIFLLAACVIGFAVYVNRQPQLRSQWLEVLRSRTGSAALVVLLSFVVVGFLDSMHYRQALDEPDKAGNTQYSAEVLSVLDYVMSPMRDAVEKTYSAPFAVHLLTRQSVEAPDGTLTRDFPRLLHGGAHLADPQADFGPDLRQRSLKSLISALVLLVLAAALLAWQQAGKMNQPWGRALNLIVRGKTFLPWNWMLGSLFLVLLVISFSYWVGGHYHIFGTDKVGQDVYYQTIKSIRTGLMIGTLTTLVMLPFAVGLGIMAGYFRGWVDDVIQYVYTTLNSIPYVLLIAAAVLMMQVYIANNPEVFDTAAARADVRLLFLCIILGVTSWTNLCRLLRGESLKLREVDYIQAAWAFGVSHTKVITRHIMPNVMHIILITVVLDFSALVLAEAVLSYVGVGVDPTMNSWGNMINGARLEMAREPMVWWSLAAAFVFMFTLVLAANLFSDAVRDAFDPRLRQR